VLHILSSQLVASEEKLMPTQSTLRELPLVRRVSGLKSETYRRFRERRLPAAIYEALFYVGNRVPTRQYRQFEAQFERRPIEERVVRELREDGISLAKLDDLLPEPAFEQIRAWGEKLVAAPSNQERIKLIESGARPEARSGKYFLVRLLGDRPTLDFNDAGVRMSISAAMLRIISGYFGMFARLAELDVWYNMPTGGAPIMSQQWHRDPEDKRMIKAFLYLRDVDETTGPLSFVRGSHNSGSLKHVRPRNAGMYPPLGFVEENFPKEQIRVCTGEAGTIAFADTTGFHKGGQPSKHARLLFNCMYTTNAAIPLVLKSPMYSITGSPNYPLEEMASYAVGHLSSAKS
jgi:ectoine hydroxylase-related dioxygenase (phytanoyl-CoA dioxygenase family)